jgi:hypothetical protein
MRLHLLVCSWCRRYERQLRFLRRHTHAEHEDAPSPQLSNDTRERLKKTLSENSRVEPL